MHGSIALACAPAQSGDSNRRRFDPNLRAGDDPAESRTLSYAELHAEVCCLPNGLKSLGIRKGDRVTLYLPMVPEARAAFRPTTNPQELKHECN